MVSPPEFVPIAALSDVLEISQRTFSDLIELHVKQPVPLRKVCIEEGKPRDPS